MQKFSLPRALLAVVFILPLLLIYPQPIHAADAVPADYPWYANNYPYRSDSTTSCSQGGPCVADPWNFYQRECTSYVAWRLNHELDLVNAGIVFTNNMGGQTWGNAVHWKTAAIALGYAVNNTPRVGAIAWWGTNSGGAGPVGHVAYVDAVNANGTVNISEYNWNYGDGDYNVRTNLVADKYIHFNDGAIINTDLKGLELPTVPVKEAGTQTPVYRFYNLLNKTHTFTASVAEKKSFQGVKGWRAEGLSFYGYNTQQPGTEPVYRLVRKTNGDNLLTISATEYNNANATGLFYDKGIAFYAYADDASGRVAVYRLWNNKTGAHFFTGSAVERDNAIAVGWILETTGFYALPTDICSSTGSCPVSRLYNAGKLDHFFTSSYAEAKSAIEGDNRWDFENTVFYVFQTQASASVPVWRFRHNASGAKFLTANVAEKNSLMNNPGWTYEQIAFYAYNSSGANRVPVYRLWRKVNSSHMYTASLTEYNALKADTVNWADEGIAFYANNSFQ